MVLSASVKVRQVGGWILMESDTDGMEWNACGVARWEAQPWGGLAATAFREEKGTGRPHYLTPPPKSTSSAGQRAGFKVRV